MNRLADDYTREQTSIAKNRMREICTEVGDQRFNSSEIQRLYEADDYPLRKPE
jgi:hypothetical protein